jgi:hypothetical protein
MQQFSTQDKEFKNIYDMESHFSSIGISHTIFMIYKLSMVHEVPWRPKEA